MLLPLNQRLKIPCHLRFICVMSDRKRKAAEEEEERERKRIQAEWEKNYEVSIWVSVNSVLLVCS